MPTKKLTDLFVERVKPSGHGRVEYFDAAFGGLALRVTANGHKSWSLHYRMGGRLRRLTIGTHPAIKPAQARLEAQQALDRMRAGTDPAEEKRARRDRRLPEAGTFGAVAEDYLTRHMAKNNAPSTYAEARRDLEKHALPRWRNRPIATITRRDALDLIDGIAARGAEIQANRTLTRLRALFNWAIEKDRLAESPVARMKLPTKERPRDRVLKRQRSEACSARPHEDQIGGVAEPLRERTRPLCRNFRPVWWTWQQQRSNSLFRARGCRVPKNQQRHRSCGS